MAGARMANSIAVSGQTVHVIREGSSIRRRSDRQPYTDKIVLVAVNIRYVCGGGGAAVGWCGAEGAEAVAGARMANSIAVYGWGGQESSRRIRQTQINRAREKGWGCCKMVSC